MRAGHGKYSTFGLTSRPAPCAGGRLIRTSCSTLKPKRHKNAQDNTCGACACVAAGRNGCGRGNPAPGVAHRGHCPAGIQPEPSCRQCGGQRLLSRHPAGGRSHYCRRPRQRQELRCRIDADQPLVDGAAQYPARVVTRPGGEPHMGRLDSGTGNRSPRPQLAGRGQIPLAG